MSPFDQLAADRSKLTDGTDRRITAPDCDPVRQCGKRLHPRDVRRGGVEHIDIVTQERAVLQQCLKEPDRQTAVCLRELEQIDIPSQKPLDDAPCRKCVQIAGSNVQEKA